MSRNNRFIRAPGMKGVEPVERNRMFVASATIRMLCCVITPIRQLSSALKNPGSVTSRRHDVSYSTAVFGLAWSVSLSGSLAQLDERGKALAYAMLDRFVRAVMDSGAHLLLA